MPIRVDDKDLCKPVWFGVDFSKERDRTVMVTGRRQGKTLAWE